MLCIYIILFSHPILNNINSSLKSLLIVLLIAFPIELIGASISGRNYFHYYITWLPSIALLSGFFVFFYSRYLIKARYLIKVGNEAGLLIVLILLCIFPFNIQVSRIQSVRFFLSNQSEDQIIRFITENSSVNDYVLMWGAEAVYNFKSERKSPTRFVYQYPLFMEGYQEEIFTREFLSELENNKPKLIIDTSFSNPDVPPIISNELNNELFEVSKFIETNYNFQYKFDHNHWKVYLLKEP